MVIWEYLGLLGMLFFFFKGVLYIVYYFEIVLNEELNEENCF